jgi:glycyl-tRNA synthetase beta subunit
MKRKSSDSFLNEVTERVNRLKQISEESSLDYTQELVKTLQRLSDISASNTSEINYSEDSADLNESNLILQPTNSLFDDSSMDSKVSLITSIKNKNDELQKACSKKLMELRTTTKEFAKSRQGIRVDSPDRKVSSSMQRS